MIKQLKFKSFSYASQRDRERIIIIIIIRIKIKNWISFFEVLRFLFDYIYFT